MVAVVKFPVVMVDPCGCHSGFPAAIIQVPSWAPWLNYHGGFFMLGTHVFPVDSVVWYVP